MSAEEMPASTRSTILEAAIALIRERGMEAISVRDIAQRAGVNVALINYYFFSKDALVDEVLEVLIGELAEKLAGRIEGRSEPGLGSFAKAYSDFLVANEALLKSSFARIIAGTGAPGPLVQFVRGKGLAGLAALLAAAGGKEASAVDVVQFISAIVLPMLLGPALGEITGLDMSSASARERYLETLVERFSK